MFRALAGVPVPNFGSVNQQTPPTFGAARLFQLHPTEIVALLELAWDSRQQQAPDVGGPFSRSTLTPFRDTWFGRNAYAVEVENQPVPGRDRVPPQAIEPLVIAISRRGGNFVLFDHLIYAYMIENTKIREIFRRVVHEFLHGERLGGPSPATQQWLRTTEQLFFRDPPSPFVTSVQSDIRPDADATRRNAYQRMFGMDLNHGGADNKPYPYVRADASNKEFVSTFEELLREVWVGMINANNATGPRATDDGRLRVLLRNLQDMLVARRVSGNLSREEFTFVSMMSWFHLTVETDTAVVNDLRANGAASAEQRLFKIAQLVGLPAHGLSGSYFDIADSISRLLILIEAGFFASVPDAVIGLYTPGSPLEQAMRTIITHWSVISGRDMKADKLVLSVAARRPA
jgi:hypothetical protein